MYGVKNMKAFYCAYPINENIKRSFADAAYNKEWLSALKELSNPDSMCVPRFLFKALKSVISDQSDERLYKVVQVLHYMTDTLALKLFKEEEDAISWDILTRFMDWKKQMLPDIIKRGQLYWDVLKSSKFSNCSIIYPPIVHGFIELSSTDAIQLANQLSLLPLPAHNRNLFLMLVFKFYNNHQIKTSKRDPYEFTYKSKDQNYSLYKRITKKMFEFIELIEANGFEMAGRGVKRRENVYTASSLFEKFLQWAHVAENPKTYLFLTVIKYYIFFHFISFDDYANRTCLKTDL